MQWRRRMNLGILAVVAAILVVGLFFAVQNGRARSLDVPSTSTNWSGDSAGQEAEFWSVIEATNPAHRGDQRQLAELRRRLDTLSTPDLESFIRVNDRLMAQSYNWDLWGAAYVAQGGASDDAFEDFRKWLISNGKSVFEQVSADPDSLADIIPAGYEGDASFEEFSYLFADIWTERTGKPITDLPKEKGSLYPSEPNGEPFVEDPEQLSARYPKLWARFGEDPLQ